VTAQVLPFVPRRTQLRLLELRRVRRFVQPNGDPRPFGARERQRLDAERARDAAREAEWALRHGPVPGGAQLLRFAERPTVTPESVLNAGGANGR
jgi:hypothetical protein